jgi:DNA-binding NtrC family response regulator
VDPLKTFGTALSSLFNALGFGQKIALVTLLITAVAAGMFFFQQAAEDYDVLYANLTLPDAAAMAAKLKDLEAPGARELFEREYLLTQINRFGGNISRTASFVGMERSALHRKLKSLGLSGARTISEGEEG